MVAGTVAITPACGTVGPMGAIALGVIAAAACYFFVTVVKNKLKYDDSLDVFGVHGVGGIIGAILTGVFSAGSLGGVRGRRLFHRGAGLDSDRGRGHHAVVGRRFVHPVQAGGYDRRPASMPTRSVRALT